MNFLNFLTSGMSLFNFGLQENAEAANKETLQPILKTNLIIDKPQQTNLDFPPSQNSLEKENQQKELPNPLGESNQLLISQYLKLNMQFLEKQMQLQGKMQVNKEGEEKNVEESVRVGNKKTKKVNKCGHPDKSHYAKGMCNNCYHKYGRTKKPWNCPHDKLYAAGMCQNCYINSYNRKKRQQKSIMTEQMADELKAQNIERIKENTEEKNQSD